MNHNQDMAFKSIKIISNNESSNTNSGCLILNKIETMSDHTPSDESLGGISV